MPAGILMANDPKPEAVDSRLYCELSNCPGVLDRVCRIEREILAGRIKDAEVELSRARGSNADAWAEILRARREALWQWDATEARRVRGR